MERFESGDGFVEGSLYVLWHLGEDSQESIAMGVVGVENGGEHGFISAWKYLFPKKILA